MLDRIADLPGTELCLASYSDAFDEAYEGIVFWKLERRQTFREPGVPSWEAFAEGDWARALELNERERDAVRAKVADDRRLGVQSRRLRVVEHPVTPYLQWEMQYFRLLAEAGEDLRVVDASAVRHLEADRLLPEIVILGDRVLFEVSYDAEGTAYGARRIDDPRAITGARTELADLYLAAEPLLDYFEREIAALPPPAL
ncbi:hypothetical protein NE235_18925 [Actinoallomurus spadix]|uniref:DUF6879 domain-containing protein n=1 Tax=Actinoallomurus spadix TaxID=79912 RepID=A0ABN0W099_9ACTN|nr:DUF6879 family protein [Actinoallomurus spadix]MCO5988179.1 hypothetical protein [Actinoallomurus spadix]